MKHFSRLLGVICFAAMLTATACSVDLNKGSRAENAVSEQLMYEEVVTDTLQMPDHADNKTILFHNNGQSMAVDYIDSKQDSIIAVYRSVVNGMQYESTYVSTGNGFAKEDLLQLVSSGEQHFLRTEEAALWELWEYAADTQIKRTTWLIQRDSESEASIASTAILTRDCDVPHNNKPASLWLIKTITNYESVNAKRLNELRHIVDVGHDGQYLINYAPNGDASGSSVSGALSYGDIQTLACNFTLDGFKMSNDTSMTDNYGLWRYEANAGANSDLRVEAAVIATNTASDFYLQVRNDYDVNTSHTQRYKNCGCVTYRIPDR